MLLHELAHAFEFLKQAQTRLLGLRLFDVY